MLSFVRLAAVAALVLICSALPGQSWEQQYLKYPAVMRADVKGQMLELQSVVATSITTEGDIWNLHANGLESLYGVSDDGEMVVSYYGNSKTGAKAPQGPIGGEPVPVLTTSWCDKDGVTHTVSTPIVSQTPAGVEKATKLHEQLVSILQAKHPPKPCPPPPPGH